MKRRHRPRAQLPGDPPRLTRREVVLAFGVIALSSFQRPQELSPALPEDADAVGPAFINRVYSLASQI